MLKRGSSLHFKIVLLESQSYQELWEYMLATTLHIINLSYHRCHIWLLEEEDLNFSNEAIRTTAETVMVKVNNGCHICKRTSYSLV